MREQFDEFIQRHQTGVKVGLVAVALVVLAVVIGTMVQRIGKEAVTVEFAPFNAKVSIEGKRVGNNRKIYLEAGTYTFRAELEHFETYETTVEIVKGGNLNYAIGELVPTDEEGEKIQKKRQRDYQDVEAVASYIENALGGQKLEAYPILEYLPDNHGAYSVSYKYDEAGNFQVELVLKNEAFIASAVAQLYRYPNIDPLDYEIVVRDFEAPFGVFRENSATELVEYIERGYNLDAMGYRIVANRIVEEGDYYGVIMIPKDVDLNNDGALYTPYKMIVQKKMGGNWKKVTDASLIFSKLNMGDAPRDFVNELNRVFAVGEV